MCALNNHFSLDVQAASDKGNKRDHNEDMIMIGNTIFRDAKIRLEFDTQSQLTLAVADGMGGQNAGEIASEKVLESLLKFCENLDAGYSESHLRSIFNDWVIGIHDQLMDEGNQNPERFGMGTTLCGLVIYACQFYAMNAGDSRLYRFRKGILEQISNDHSLAAASDNPNIPSNIIVNAIGGGKQAYLDFEDITDRLDSGDVLLICSDGLSDMLSDTDIENILKNGGSAKSLVDAANNAGGKDNISVILATLECSALDED